ncbi:type II toxin-antitoxin system VapB family antitoxin [Rhizobium sp. ZK1]|uniref:type II toxin-antitoxin system VapB family antitoxin n=1 Tax=Rhizobium sp. ZK1 TaxID=3389872 RepID=UPI0039F72B4C
MLHLTHDTEQLARRLAARVGRKPEDLIRAALEREAKALGVSEEPQPRRRRMTVEQMLAVGEKITALPLLDPRSPQEIAGDLNDP